jgi:hypothetical protein
MMFKLKFTDILRQGRHMKHLYKILSKCIVLITISLNLKDI